MLGGDRAVPASEFLKERRGGSFQAGDGNSEQWKYPQVSTNVGGGQSDKETKGVCLPRQTIA